MINELTEILAKYSSIIDDYAKQTKQLIPSPVFSEEDFKQEGLVELFSVFELHSFGVDFGPKQILISRILSNFFLDLLQNETNAQVPKGFFSGIEQQVIDVAMPEITHEYHTIVNSFAVSTWKKIHKPTIYTVSDLYQDGMFKIISILKNSSWNPEKGPLKALILISLRNYYLSIVSASYKENSKTSKIFPRKPDGTFLFDNATNSDFFNYLWSDTIEETNYKNDASLLFVSLSEFSEIEKQYLSEFLFPEILDRKSFRKRGVELGAKIRKKLGISYKKERQLRENIFKKLQELLNEKDY